MTTQEEIIEALEQAVGYYVRESQDRTFGAEIRSQDQNTAEALQLVLEMFKRGPAKWDVIDPSNVGYTADIDPREWRPQRWLDESTVIPLYALPEKVK